MNDPHERVVCRTPTPGKNPTTIDRWKFEAVRTAMLDAVGDYPDGLTFKELPKEVESRLAPADLERLGSLMWYVTTVKLELEVRGEIERVAKSSPQRLQLGKS